ncbi:MAG TPA: hypothetical protein VE155_12680 [Pseudonocardiaceae bacterium]|jgi:hypothetical protein|nr:hypothetical protein [Pseudonocardiaceae bacterium]
MPKTSTQILINPHRSGVVYDLEGHSIGGGERVEIAQLDEVGQAALDRGHLIVAELSSDPETDGASRPK